jgi:hypothetical protein
MSAGDNFIFNSSLQSEIDGQEFISKKWLQINDQNNGSYGTQIIFDLQSLANSGRWQSLQEGIMLVPLVVQLTSATSSSLPSASPTLANYVWALKNSYISLINSITIEMNNNNVVNQTQLINIYKNFEYLTSFSQDDLTINAPSFGFAKDTSTSWSYNNNYSTSGGNTLYNSRGMNCGFSNNASAPSVITSFLNTYTGASANQTLPINAIAGLPSVSAAVAGVSGVSYSGAGTPSLFFGGEGQNNSGMLQRQQMMDYDDDSAGVSLGQYLINNPSTIGQFFQNAKQVQTQDGSVSWNVFAKIRLKDISDFFEKICLIKGSTMRMYININQTLLSFSTTTGTINNATGLITSTLTYPVLSCSSVNILGGQTNPLMISSNAFGQGSSTLPTDNYQISVSVFRNAFSQQATLNGNNYNLASNQNLQSCRIYVPVYEFSPLVESRYLSLAPTKRIRYKDVQMFQYNNIAGAGASISVLISNGLTNLTGVLCVPFISQSNSFIDNTGTAKSSLPFNALQTPFDTTPSTPHNICISNFNIVVSGVNLFLNNTQYNWENYREHLSQVNSINGNNTNGFTSGLISERDFDRLYKYYYGSCERILPSEEGISRSVQIIGTNQSQVAIDIIVFCEFWREIVVDVATGARID